MVLQEHYRKNIRNHMIQLMFCSVLVNYMLKPEIMYDLLEAIADWKINHLKQIFENIHPDVIRFHDVRSFTRCLMQGDQTDPETHYRFCKIIRRYIHAPCRLFL